MFLIYSITSRFSAENSGSVSCFLFFTVSSKGLIYSVSLLVVRTVFTLSHWVSVKYVIQSVSCADVLFINSLFWVISFCTSIYFSFSFILLLTVLFTVVVFFSNTFKFTQPVSSFFISSFSKSLFSIFKLWVLLFLIYSITSRFSAENSGSVPVFYSLLFQAKALCILFLYLL